MSEGEGTDSEENLVDGRAERVFEGGVEKDIMNGQNMLDGQGTCSEGSLLDGRAERVLGGSVEKDMLDETSGRGPAEGMVESLGAAESIFSGPGGSSGHDSKVGGKENWPQRVKSAQRDFREELKKLNDDSYLCEDIGTLESSTKVLADLRKSFESHCNREHGLMLNKQHNQLKRIQLN